MFLGWIIISASLFLILAIPETLNLYPAQTSKSHSGTAEEAELDDYPDQTDDDFPDSPISFRHRPLTTSAIPGSTIRSKIRSRLRTLQQSSRFMTSNPQVLLLLAIFVVYRLSRGAGNFMLQYIGKRYSWTLSKARFLFSLRAAVNIVLLLAILPVAS